jgi:hypothetical protein
MMQSDDYQIDPQKKAQGPNQQALLGQLGAPPLAPEAPALPAAPMAPPSMAAPPAPAGGGLTQALAGGLGQYAGKLEGFDKGKLDSGHDSPKYQFGRTMSQFDPKGGITQAMLDALNGLGLGTVSGKVGGDKISVGGNVDPRFQGVTEFDIIRDLENGGGWQWDGGGGAPSAAPQQAGGLSPLLAGNPMQGIQAALGQYSEQGDNLKALLAALGQA